MCHNGLIRLCASTTNLVKWTCFAAIWTPVLPKPDNLGLVHMADELKAHLERAKLRRAKVISADSEGSGVSIGSEATASNSTEVLGGNRGCCVDLLQRYSLLSKFQESCPSQQ